MPDAKPLRTLRCPKCGGIERQYSLHCSGDVVSLALSDHNGTSYGRFCVRCLTRELAKLVPPMEDVADV